MCVPLYLMCISCSPASVGEYCTVTVPSRLSVISGWADFPEGIRTSPAKEGRSQRLRKKCLATRDKPPFRHVVSPVISPLRKENGITMSKGLKPLPFTLLLVGSYLSDVTLRKTRGTRSEVGPARRLAARETHAAAAAAATARPRTLAPSWEVEVQSRRGG